jgi:hypothetical protein
MRTQPLSALVRLAKDYVHWPKMRPGEVLRVETGEDHGILRDEYSDGYRVSAHRFFPDDPRGEWREAHAIIDGREVHYATKTGSRDRMIRAVLQPLKMLALLLSAKPPKGWRLFGRAKAPMTRWSRLMTRPLRVTYADKETR